MPTNPCDACRFVGTGRDSTWTCRTTHWGDAGEEQDRDDHGRLDGRPGSPCRKL